MPSFFAMSLSERRRAPGERTRGKNIAFRGRSQCKLVRWKGKETPYDEYAVFDVFSGSFGAVHRPFPLVPPRAPKGRQPFSRFWISKVAAWNRGDLDGYMAGYWKSDQLSFFSNGKKTMGWQRTLDHYR